MSHLQIILLFRKYTVAISRLMDS